MCCTGREERGRFLQVIRHTKRHLESATFLFDFVLLYLAAVRLHSLAFLLAQTPGRVRCRTTVIRVDGYSDVRNCGDTCKIGTCASRTQTQSAIWDPSCYCYCCCCCCCWNEGESHGTGELTQRDAFPARGRHGLALSLRFRLRGFSWARAAFRAVPAYGRVRRD